MRGRWWREADAFLVLLVLAVSILGLIAVASATHAGAGAASGVWVRRQAVWLVAGILVMALVASIDYHVWASIAWPLYGINLALLAAVLAVGREALGAQRWLQLGPIPVQPSELAKVLVVLTLASQLAPRVNRIGSWRDFLLPLLHVAAPAALVLAQPDLGTSLVFFAIVFGMLYAAGMPGRRVLAVALGGIGAAVAAVIAHLRWHVPIPMRDYQLQRLLAFTNPNADPLGTGYHILQSEIAIGSGGLRGQGLYGGATASQLSFLPEAQTDFIFAVISQNLGFLGASALLLAFLLILWRALQIATQARDALGYLMAVGVSSMIGFHVLVNVGMTMGIMPVTGVPLPFTSYGGSALLANYAGVGLLLSVRLRRRKIQF